MIFGEHCRHHTAQRMPANRPTLDGWIFCNHITRTIRIEESQVEWHWHDDDQVPLRRNRPRGGRIRTRIDQATWVKNKSRGRFASAWAKDKPGICLHLDLGIAFERIECL